jgi:hypothetical protein
MCIGKEKNPEDARMYDSKKSPAQWWKTSGLSGRNQ